MRTHHSLLIRLSYFIVLIVLTNWTIESFAEKPDEAMMKKYRCTPYLTGNEELNTSPNYRDSYQNYIAQGLALEQAGQLKEAIVQYCLAIALRMTDSQWAHNYLHRAISSEQEAQEEAANRALLFQVPSAVLAQEFPFQSGEGPCDGSQGKAIRLIIRLNSGRQIIVDPRSASDLGGIAKSVYSLQGENGPITLSDTDLKAILPVCKWKSVWTKYAVGTVTFSRQLPPSRLDFLGHAIAVGTDKQDNYESFYTIESVRMRKSDATISARIIAKEPGERGVVPARSIRFLQSSALGITGVTNEQPTKLSTQ